jgi:MraZ protein
VAKQGSKWEIVENPFARHMPDLANSPVFDGQETYTLDDKGRVTVPRRWRSEGDDEEVYHLVPDVKKKCLRVMHGWRYRQFADEVKAKVGDDLARYRNFMRNFNSNSTRIEADKQARIAIPKLYRDTLGLDGEVLMLGCGDLIEIWKESTYRAAEPELLADYVQLSEGVGL